MKEIITWLLEGDVSVQCMTHKHILNSEKTITDQLQNRIPVEGFGARLLSCRSGNGHWGLHYYQPKWTSTHYTLLDLKNLYVPIYLESCRDMVERMFGECANPDGGMNLSKYVHPSDIAVDGMVLNYASYFSPDHPQNIELVKHLLQVQRTDGGFTWDYLSEKGDPHTTICVLEGLYQFCISIPDNKITGIDEAKTRAFDFLLANKLFLR